jgi:hypothetical protein
VRKQQKRFNFSAVARDLGLQTGSRGYYDLEIHASDSARYPWQGMLFRMLDKPLQPPRFRQKVKQLVEASTGIKSGFRA